MRKIIALLSIVTLCLSANAQDKDGQTILDILDRQTKAWNKGDLENFMKGYWNNDSLMFIGSKGVTYGYNNTLENYRKGYDGPDKMGQLTFNILQLKRVSTDSYFVVGKWSLKRNAGDVSGHYTLLFRKIKGEWVIVADHSS